MTLDKHQIDGVGGFPAKVLPAQEFEKLLIQAGYANAGSAKAKGNRTKVWWTHTKHRRVEAIYSRDRMKVITAYHTS